MEGKQNSPIGIELVRKGIIKESDINIAINYQKNHPDRKLGDILQMLKICDSEILIKAMEEILGERMMILRPENIQINVTDYVSLDIMQKNKAIPFEIVNGKIKVCFSDNSDKKSIEIVRLLFLNKGLVMEKYITFASNMENVMAQFVANTGEDINLNKDMITLVDSIIKKAIEKRASDIHFEPYSDNLRVRYRIDGELITEIIIPSEKQTQMIGRLKAISNMHQEKQESQDGRIIIYPNYNIRVSSQKNIYGEKIVLRLLKQNENVRSLYDLGIELNDEELKAAFDKKNSITIIAAPTGEGKTTTLYSIIDYLNKPEINVTTIEEPVEIRIDGLNQVEVDGNINFSNSLRTVLRQDPDIILVGEIRDKETAEIAMQARTNRALCFVYYTYNRFYRSNN